MCQLLPHPEMLLSSHPLFAKSSSPLCPGFLLVHPQDLASVFFLRKPPLRFLPGQSPCHEHRYIHFPSGCHACTYRSASILPVGLIPIKLASTSFLSSLELPSLVLPLANQHPFLGYCRERKVVFHNLFKDFFFCQLPGTCQIEKLMA